MLNCYSQCNIYDFIYTRFCDFVQLTYIYVLFNAEFITKLLLNTVIILTWWLEMKSINFSLYHGNVISTWKYDLKIFSDLIASGVISGPKFFINHTEKQFFEYFYPKNKFCLKESTFKSKISEISLNFYLRLISFNFQCFQWLWRCMVSNFNCDFF